MSTPLDRIRAAELEAARRVETARSEADSAVTDGREQAQELVQRAREEGATEANARYDQAIAEAEQEAKRIEGEPDAAIAELRAAVEPRLDELVDRMLEMILSPPAETGV